MLIPKISKIPLVLIQPDLDTAALTGDERGMNQSSCKRQFIDQALAMQLHPNAVCPAIVTQKNMGEKLHA